MRSIFQFWFLLSLFFCIDSCKIKNDNKLNFYDSNQRIGLWINSEMEDTLHFIDQSKLIRKGKYYTYEEYLYRIYGETLFIRKLDSSNESQHSISTSGKNSVVLSNMYISIGFGDNSGTFTKPI